MLTYSVSHGISMLIETDTNGVTQMTSIARHEIAKIKSAISSFKQQLSFNPHSECNQIALAQSQVRLAEIMTAKAA